MKSLNLAVIVTSVMVAVSGMAQAESANTSNHNFMSKRPYQAPLENKAYNPEDKWEGTTLRADEAVEDSAAVKKNSTTLKQLRLNSLGRRPHMD